MSQQNEVDVESKSLTYGAVQAEPQAAVAQGSSPCSFGMRPPSRFELWRPVLAKASLGALMLGLLTALGRASMQDPGRTLTVVAEAQAQSKAAAGQNEDESQWTASVPAEPQPVAANARPCPQESKAPSVALSDQKSPEAASPAVGQQENGPRVTAEGKVILNQAEVADLVKLPGVGPKRAEDILKLRKRLGKFRKVQDLLRVKGIGLKSLRKIEPLVVVDIPNS